MTFTKSVWKQLIETDEWLDRCTRSLSLSPTFTARERKMLSQLAASIEASAAMLNLYSTLQQPKKK